MVSRAPLPTQARVRAWWESPAVLAIAGALSIHLLIATFADAMTVLHPPYVPPPPPPSLELVDVEIPAVVSPPPPPVAHDEPPPPPIQPAAPPPPPVAHHIAASRAPAPPSPEPLPPAETPQPAPSDDGGGPVVHEEDIAPGATGVAVAVGPRTTGHIGRGGSGTGTWTGNGAGSGSGDQPMSIATIKTRALPHGDYSYQEAKDYPLEAKRLGIQGKIKVRLVVDERGAVRSALLLDHLGYGLDELALRRAKLIQFDPAKDSSDQPVTSIVVWTFDLALPKQ